MPCALWQHLERFELPPLSILLPIFPLPCPYRISKSSIFHRFMPQTSFDPVNPTSSRWPHGATLRCHQATVSQRHKAKVSRRYHPAAPRRRRAAAPRRLGRTLTRARAVRSTRVVHTGPAAGSARWADPMSTIPLTLPQAGTALARPPSDPPRLALPATRHDRPPSLDLSRPTHLFPDSQTSLPARAPPPLLRVPCPTHPPHAPLEGMPSAARSNATPPAPRRPVPGTTTAPPASALNQVLGTQPSRLWLATMSGD